MKRALREYEVFGIRTTVPFFRWMLAQPAFEAAKFHTAYLDELLQQRQGAPFEIPGDDEGTSRPPPRRCAHSPRREGRADVASLRQADVRM